jgi:hypothetical protein
MEIKDANIDLPNSKKNKCIINVARTLGDKNICYQIGNDANRQQKCLEYLAEDMPNN